MLKNDLYENVDLYHGDYSRLSATMFKRFIDNPGDYWDLYVDQNCDPDPPSDTMVTGDIMHAMILEKRVGRTVVGIYPDHDPDLSEIRDLSGPKRDKLPPEKIKRFAKILGCAVEDLQSAKGGKELNALKAKVTGQPISSKGSINESAAAEHRKKHPEYKHWLKRSKFNLLKQSVNAFWFSEWRELFEQDGALIEVPLVWDDIRTGIPSRALLDCLILAPPVAIVSDLKITVNVLNFSKSYNDFSYFVPQVHYTNAVKANYPDIEEVKFKFVAHEPPIAGEGRRAKNKRPSKRFATTCNALPPEEYSTVENYYDFKMDQLAEYLQDTKSRWNHPATEVENEIQIWKRSLS